MARSSPLPGPALGGMVLAFLASLLSPSTKDSESVCLSGDTGPEGSPLPKATTIEGSRTTGEWRADYSNLGGG